MERNPKDATIEGCSTLRVRGGDEEDGADGC